MKVRTILFIDDEEMICEIAEDVLSQLEKAQVVSFKNAANAIDYAKSHEQELCLAFIDLNLAGQSGVDIRKLLPQDLICVLITGETLNDKPEDLGFADVLEKPFRESDLLSLAEKWLKHKSAS